MSYESLLDRVKKENKMKEIIKIFENSMSLTITTIIAAIGVGLNVWFKKKRWEIPKGKN